MAATRLIALHINKGKTVAQCLADRTDYSQNAAKTEDGKYISSYECDPKTADEEFLLTKRQYQHMVMASPSKRMIGFASLIQLLVSLNTPGVMLNIIYKIYIGNTATTFLMSNIRSIIKELKKKVVGNRYITK